jgi:hypothetical protein
MAIDIWKILLKTSHATTSTTTQPFLTLLVFAEPLLPARAEVVTD